MRFTSDLNLDGRTPLRARPQLGEWGPVNVPSTRFKKWQRIIILVAVIIMITSLVIAEKIFVDRVDHSTGQSKTVLIRHQASASVLK